MFFYYFLKFFITIYNFILTVMINIRGYSYFEIMFVNCSNFIIRRKFKVDTIFFCTVISRRGAIIINIIYIFLFIYYIILVIKYIKILLWYIWVLRDIRVLRVIWIFFIISFNLYNLKIIHFIIQYYIDFYKFRTLIFNYLFY